MNEDFYSKLGHRIKFLRKQKCLTQQELADKIGKGLNFVGKIEVTFSKPSLDTLIDIANTFELSVSDLTKFE